MNFDADLVALLMDVFPDSFNAVRRAATTETKNGEYGTETIITGEHDSILAENILVTATAIRRKYGERAIAYIKMFANPAEQKKDLKAFYSSGKSSKVIA